MTARLECISAPIVFCVTLYGSVWIPLHLCRRANVTWNKHPMHGAQIKALKVNVW